MVVDYIPVRFIGTYQAMLGLSWGLGYVVGVLLGKRRGAARGIGKRLTHVPSRQVAWP